MIDYFPDSRAHWIWRGHIDFSTPNREVFDFLLPSIKRYDAAIFHMREYVPKAEGLPPCYIWPPAIDPLAPKNMALSAEDAAYIVDQFGIDVERPLLTQVSRFDPWKDPLGVIDAYRLVKEEFPDVQLALVGSMAHDDPEGWDFYNQTVAYAGGDPDIYILSNLNNVGSVEVNAFQVHSGCSDPEVDPGGLRADRHGERSGRRARPSPAVSAGSSCRSRTARPAGSSTRRPSARRRASRSCATRKRRASARCAARSTCGDTS